jgi:hypothetical protein
MATPPHRVHGLKAPVTSWMYWPAALSKRLPAEPCRTPNTAVLESRPNLAENS